VKQGRTSRASAQGAAQREELDQQAPVLGANELSRQAVQVRPRLIVLLAARRLRRGRWAFDCGWGLIRFGHGEPPFKVEMETGTLEGMRIARAA
jgi:hypothetical protein